MSTLQPTPLADLIRATAAGDQKAFERLYAETSPRLFAIVLRLCRRRDWAEEVLQEVYLSIWDHAGDYRPERGAPMAWLATIGRNRALDRLRRQRPETSIDAVEGSGQWADPEPGPLDWALAGAQARRLKYCLDQLDDLQRSCILMAMIEGYTHGELARRLETPLGTIKSWLRRGLQRVRECIER